MDNRKLSIDEAYFDQQYAKHSFKGKKQSHDTAQKNLLSNGNYNSLNHSVQVSRSGSQQMQNGMTGSAGSLPQQS